MAPPLTVEEQPTVHELTIPAEESQLSRVRDFVEKICEEAGLSAREVSNTKLAVDEACTNIIKHAYKRRNGDIGIRIETVDSKVEIKLRDSGEKFDFASVQDPDLDHYVETGRKGGLGVFLINRLMDRVDYRSSAGSNELVMVKQGRAMAAGLPGRISWRGSLRYKFTMRATVGLFVLIAAIGGYIFARQSSTINEQRATYWLEKRRLAENVANKSRELLLRSERYSVQQTNLTAFVARVLEGNSDLAFVRVVDNEGQIVASGDIDEVLTTYEPANGRVLLDEDGRIVWTRIDGERPVRDIAFRVSLRSPDADRVVDLGTVHVGAYEDGLATAIHDPRPVTSLIMIAFFFAGVLLVMSLVSVFVKPIQVLTDGVRAIGQGSLDGRISVEGPAEIGAIAAVFNEMTSKFRQAQESVLEQEKLQKEIEVAKQIQQALLPKKHPDVSGYDIAPYYQAAKEVGGDYYDFVQVDEDTLGVVVADVSGKGVPGSLVMTMIRTALRMEARGNKNASDVMSKMNDFVTDDMKKGMFVTMFYVILDSKNRIISYASAGHNPMILYRYETNETFFLNPKGFPVGISLPDERLFRRSISLEKIKLKKDDMLLIYTDGVTEAMNERRDQFGEERLLEVVKKYGHLHPSEFIGLLEKEIRTFTGGNPQNDDITVVAVKEKLTADDVLFGIRKKLIDMVDVEGLSVKEACKKMKVSPATYYRYKKRMAVMGDRGLKNKVLRQDVELKRVSIEDRKDLMDIIRRNPAYGAKRISQEFNAGHDSSRHLSPRLVYDELKRLNLNTKELRLDYLKRNRLIGDEEFAEAARRTNRQMVEDLIRDVTKHPPEKVGGETAEEGEDLELEPTAARSDEDEGDWGDDATSDLRVAVDEIREDVVVIRVDGHLDSVSSAVLEAKLKECINREFTKIAIDLTSVSYISSGGWGIIVGEVKRLRSQSGDVVLVGMTAEVYDVFELLGFNDILKSFVAEDAALSYFNLPPEERFAAGQKPEPETATGQREEVETSLVDDVRASSYTADWESLQIEAATVGDEGDMAVISLKGIIDTISAEHLRSAIDKVISGGIYKIVVDLSLVEYVSSGGWGTFTERLREVRRQHGDIKLFGMDPDVYYVFTMLGFNIVLSSFDILSEAIDDFKRSAEGRPSVHPDHTEAVSQASYEASREPADGITAVDVDSEEDESASEDILAYVPKTIAAEHTMRLVWDETDGVLVASLCGTIDSRSVDEIEGEVLPCLQHKPKAIVFDFADVDYVSSAGWGMFAKFHDSMSAWDGAVTLCEIDSYLYDVFRCLEFHTFLQTHATRDGAVAAMLARFAPEPVPTPKEEEPEPNEPVRPTEEPPVDEEVDGSVAMDRILDGVEADPAPPGDHDAAQWEERFGSPSVDVPDKAAADSPPTSTPVDAWDPVETEEESTIEIDDGAKTIDVDAVLGDERVASDESLREMGWGSYGERLREKRRREKAAKARRKGNGKKGDKS